MKSKFGCKNRMRGQDFWFKTKKVDKNVSFLKLKKL